MLAHIRDIMFAGIRVGISLTWQPVVATQFGAPQRRKRLIMVAALASGQVSGGYVDTPCAAALPVVPMVVLSPVPARPASPVCAAACAAMCAGPCARPRGFPRPRAPTSGAHVGSGAASRAAYPGRTDYLRLPGRFVGAGRCTLEMLQTAFDPIASDPLDVDSMAISRAAEGTIIMMDDRSILLDIHNPTSHC